jgi:hypothetical protein
MGIGGLLNCNCVYYTILTWQEKGKAMRMRMLNQNVHNHVYLSILMLQRLQNPTQLIKPFVARDVPPPSISVPALPLAKHARDLVSTRISRSICLSPGSPSKASTSRVSASKILRKTNECIAGVHTLHLHLHRPETAGKTLGP